MRVQIRALVIRRQPARGTFRNTRDARYLRCRSGTVRRVSTPPSTPARSQRRSRLPLIVIAITAAACLAALSLRTPLRARYWAWRVAHAANPAERGLHLGALCNAGDGGRWGIAALLAHADPEVRQYGVLSLHYLRTAWGRARLLERLRDADGNVRRLAAVGLAVHGDDGVVPTLRALYESGDLDSAVAACLALERLATPAAVAALDALSRVPADPDCRAALVNALEAVGTAECAPALLRLLADGHACTLAPRFEGIEQRVLAGLATMNLSDSDLRSLGPAGPPSTQATQTVAERAAAALARITGVQAAFSSSASEAERAQATERWQAWLAERAAER